MLIALGRTVRELRRGQQCTVEDLAAEIPIEPHKLDAIETGRFDPDFEFCSRSAVPCASSPPSS